MTLLSSFSVALPCVANEEVRLLSGALVPPKGRIIHPTT